MFSSGRLVSPLGFSDSLVTKISHFQTIQNVLTARDSLVLIAYARSECSGEPARLHAVSSEPIHRTKEHR